MVRNVLLFLLSSLFLAACNSQEVSSTLRRGGHAVISEDNAEFPTQRRHLFGVLSWLMALAIHHPVDCCKPQPPIGPPHHEWERICPSLGCATNSTLEEESFESSVETSSSTSTVGIGTRSAVSYWPLVLAAMAATTAMVAGILGQRREKAGNHHLRGSVARRMDLFSNFADQALPGDNGSVEMASSPRTNVV